MNDLVTLVDEQDRVIGSMDKIEAHRGQGQLHRAISVFLFRRHEGKTELLLQRRSLQKIVGGGQWANTACGNVWPGESYQECAHRRLGYELGIHPVQLIPISVFRYQVACNEVYGENEMDQVFAGWYDDAPSPNPAEVINYQWIDWADLVSGQASLRTQLAPWAIMLIADSAVSRGLQKFLIAN